MRLPLLALFAVALLVGGWTSLWFYVAGEAGRALDAWVAQESSQDRHWDCPRRATGGFPFALQITCDQPRFAGLVLENQASGALAALRVRVGIANPHRAEVELTSPLTYQAGEGRTDLAVQWSTLHLDISGLPDRVAAVSLSGTEVGLSGRFEASDLQTQRAARIEAGLDGFAGSTVDFTLALGKAVVPALDKLMGEQHPADFTASGQLTQASFNNNETAAALAERWRAANGTITFASARLSRGASQVAGSGLLRLDDRHCPAATLDASLSGLDPVLRHYGINPNFAKAGSILTSLFGHRDAAPRQPGNADDIRLPIQVKGCRLGIGPILTPVVLSPLY